MSVPSVPQVPGHAMSRGRFNIISGTPVSAVSPMVKYGWNRGLITGQIRDSRTVLYNVINPLFQPYSSGVEQGGTGTNCHAQRWTHLDLKHLRHNGIRQVQP